ncbi:hypothetical protein [Endozoicomonas elysicola]|uniref:Uncharacterized protein n=1 Tax=Endozoicomonas elysicola TaxID=305900 RepID=A0A081KAV0_9GAMM|nr:hypothetical protein [Endozoicomonas elysicola]KEI71276.1 hypothetical protein GV64_11455 [Endozoicomonas elysicola]
MATPTASYQPSITQQTSQSPPQSDEAEQGTCVPTSSSFVFQHGLTTATGQSNYLPQNDFENDDLYSGFFDLDIAQADPTHSLRHTAMKPPGSGAVVEAGKITITPDNCVWQYITRVEVAIKAGNHDEMQSWFTALVKELNDIEEEYENEN